MTLGYLSPPPSVISNPINGKGENMTLYSRKIDYSPEDTETKIYPKYHRDYVPEGYDHNMHKLEVKTEEPKIEEPKKVILRKKVEGK